MSCQPVMPKPLYTADPKKRLMKMLVDEVFKQIIGEVESEQNLIEENSNAADKGLEVTL